MRVLLLGSGGREHALAWKISQSPLLEELIIAPGNGGMKDLGTCLAIDILDNRQVVKTCNDYKIDYVIIGPEAPLVNGLVDTLSEFGIKAFGPDKFNAQFEGSKYFSKNFMKTMGIPTSNYVSIHTYDEGVEALKQFSYPCVVKADGLAQGKGVVIAQTEQEAKAALSDMMIAKKFSDAGDHVVIEDYVTGIEASVFALIDGESFLIFEGAQDYKRALEGGKGLNTGGMGSFSPNPVLTQDVILKVENQVVLPFIKGTKDTGKPYKGVLFIGLMVENESLSVLEFNVRFGDPETQSILPRLENDLLALMVATTEGRLDEHELSFNPKVACTVMTTSGGYPLAYQKGYHITGVSSVIEEAICFHSGTKWDNSHLMTNGGRVLSVTILEDDLSTAREKVYQEVEKIAFNNMYYRKDIGKTIQR